MTNPAEYLHNGPSVVEVHAQNIKIGDVVGMYNDDLVLFGAVQSLGTVGEPFGDGWHPAAVGITIEGKTFEVGIDSNGGERFYYLPRLDMFTVDQFVDLDEAEHFLCGELGFKDFGNMCAVQSDDVIAVGRLQGIVQAPADGWGERPQGKFALLLSGVTVEVDAATNIYKLEDHEEEVQF